MRNGEWLILKGDGVMADKMEFPKTMREFIDNHSFKDSEEIYTNGAELVPVFRVEQALEHYEKEIRNKAIDDFADKIISLCDDGEFMNRFNEFTATTILELAEQLKAGAYSGEMHGKRKENISK